LPELKTDPRFQERDTRKQNRKLLTPIIEEKLKLNTTEYWVNALNEKGVPSGAILELEDALNAEQIKHRQTIKTIKEEGIGEIKIFNMTAKFSKTPGDITSPPPRLSQNTKEILEELGYSETEINELKSGGII